ncbi:MAG: ribosome-associated translation inhibitor RaiA [Actinobacteria bacterium]|nr:ribosome-associated translation inhibitor RaiA [Actinomycetota bacterium]MBI3687821.1 ribosome-associated translation inhibitor RaiA [Actinomycetota bacterium]
MDIVVRGRNVVVPDHFRQLVSDKLSRVERYDQKVIRVDVELHHEPNPRQSQFCQRVEITCKSRGPVVRSEASAADFRSALDVAVDKLQNRLRRAHDRRRLHHGGRRSEPLVVPTAVPEAVATELAGVAWGDTVVDPPEAGAGRYAEDVEEHLPGRVVREKDHPAVPMTIDQALLEMELVGHDFFLFADAESGRPSVVYRRKGYDYGVIRLVS